MIRVILTGCRGFMGKVLTEMIAAEPEMVIAAGVDPADGPELPYPVFPEIADCDVPADAVIDFSHFSAGDGLLDYCAEKKLPLVLCTTGLSEEQIRKVEACSRQTAVLRSANMSVGINLLLKLIAEAAKVLAPAGYDMEIVEEHHHRKLDAPSGTAISLRESLNEGAGGGYEFVFDRSPRHEARGAKEIGISAVRGGSIVGEHEIIFAGQDEVIRFHHSAYSRAIFARGAVEAAKALAGKPAGLYTMADVV